MAEDTLAKALRELRLEQPHAGVKALVRELSKRAPQLDVNAKMVRNALQSLDEQATAAQDAAAANDAAAQDAASMQTPWPAPHPPEDRRVVQDRLQAQLLSDADSHLCLDSNNKFFHKTAGRGFRNTCDHCNQRAEGGIRMLECNGCHAAHYCSRECQVADWKAGHKHKCREAAATRQANSTPQAGRDSSSSAPEDVASSRASIRIVCAVSPCDVTGLFALNFIYSDGRVGMATVHLRIGFGVQNVLHTAPGSMTPMADSMPLDEIERIFYDDKKGPFTLYSPVAARVSVTIALSFLAHATKERKTPRKYANDIEALTNLLLAAGAKSQSDACKIHGLDIWYTAALSREVVVATTQGIQQMTMQALPIFLSRSLENLDACFGISSRATMRCKFSAETDLKTQGYQDDQIPDVSTVLGIFDKLEVESAGGLRTRYKRVFEFTAAWLECARTGDIHRPARSPSFNIKGKPPAELQQLMVTEKDFFERLAACVYIAGIQCSGRKMFSSGLFNESGRAQTEAYTLEDSGPPKKLPPEDDTETYARNESAACAFTVALALRYHRDHGRDRVGMHAQQ